MVTPPALVPEMSPEERTLLAGDLSRLSADQRASLVASVCRSLGLNPLTQPFAYITLNGKLTLYARKDATDQLRALRDVSIRIDSKEQIGDLYVVCVSAFLPSGRTDSEIGAVSTSGLRGEALANAMMKAITKAKRRATLSICGLGVLDETEVETIPGAQVWQEPSAPARPPALPAPEASDDRPAPALWYSRLHELVVQARLMGADEPDIPAGGLSIAQARAAKSRLVDLLTTLQADSLPPLVAEEVPE